MSQLVTSNKSNIIIKIIIFYLIFMTINFIMSNNPYYAFHNNGNAGIGNQYKFTINTAFLTIFILLSSLIIFVKNIYIPNIIVIYITIILVTGFFNGALITNYTTYLYNILSLLITVSIAYYSYKNEFNDIKIKNITYLYCMLFFLGIGLAIMFPYRYGILPFEFSRTTRGEITLWNLTSFYALFPVLMLLVYRKYRIKMPIFIYFLALIVVLSTASRTILLIMLIPLIIYIFSNVDIRTKIVYILFAFISLFLLIGKITDYFLLTDTNDFTNGRWILWLYHYNYFLQNPIVGNGAFFLKRYGDYKGVADSEIGILSIFSEYGVFAGLIILLIFIKAIYSCTKIIINFKDSNNKDLFFALIFISLMPGILDRFSRILILDDFLFWVSMFYLAIKISNGKIFTLYKKEKLEK